MTFASREDAGQQLGRHLVDRGIRADVVLGLPRGGVVVAAEVARVLHLPLDVIVVRKIGHPAYREFAVGALAENDIIVLNEAAVGRNPLLRAELDIVIAEETERLRAYQAKFHRAVPIDRRGRDVLVVDDGLATGATTEVAARAARKEGARKVIVAVPVASTQATDRLARVSDQVVALCVDPEFDAVGHYYIEFNQTTDEEVLALLRANEQETP